MQAVVLHLIVRCDYEKAASLAFEKTQIEVPKVGSWRDSPLHFAQANQGGDENSKGRVESLKEPIAATTGACLTRDFLKALPQGP